jgi:hypothetical protein
MSKLEMKLGTKGVTEEEIGRWLEDERESAAALSLNRNQYAAAEAQDAREAAIGPSSAYGSMPRERANGCFRGLYVQLNNTSTRTTANVKSAKLCDIIRQYDPHVIGLNEVGRNHSKYRSSERLSSFISDLHRESRSLAAYNELEKDISNRKYQPGGTGILVLDELIPYSRRGPIDPRKLGRWTSYIIEGKMGTERGLYKATVWVATAQISWRPTINRFCGIFRSTTFGRHRANCSRKISFINSKSGDYVVNDLSSCWMQMSTSATGPSVANLDRTALISGILLSLVTVARPPILTPMGRNQLTAFGIHQT